MPTLSFACPKCAKTYDRVRPEMVGHKVRCSCGFVFRLGNKESKDPEAAERVRQKHAKKKAKLGMHKKSKATAKATKPKEDHFDLLPSGDVGNSVHSSQLPEQLLDDLPLLEGPKPTSSRSSQDTPSSDVQSASNSGKSKSASAAPKKAKNQPVKTDGQAKQPLKPVVAGENDVELDDLISGVSDQRGTPRREPERTDSKPKPRKVVSRDLEPESGELEVPQDRVAETELIPLDAEELKTLNAPPAINATSVGEDLDPAILEPMGVEEEVYDAIMVDEPPVVAGQGPLDPLDPLGAAESSELFGTPASQPLHAAPPRQKKKRIRRHSAQGAINVGGPIWTIILSVLGLVVLWFVGTDYFDASWTLFSLQSSFGYSAKPLVAALFSGALALLHLGLFGMLLASGIVSILELVNQRYSTEMIKYTAYLGLATAVVVVMFTVISVVLFMTQDGTNRLAMQRAIFVGVRGLIVPIAVVITGLVRGR